MKKTNTQTAKNKGGLGKKLEINVYKYSAEHDLAIVSTIDTH